MNKAQLFGKHRGVGTLEILIAFAILTLALSAVIMVVFGNQSIAVDTQNNIEAISKAQELLEQARADAQGNFYSVKDSTEPDLSGPPDYTKTLAVDDPDVFTKIVTSIVTWKTDTRDLSASFSTILTNPEAVLSGETCDPEASSGWTNPQKLGTADVGQNNGATDVEVVNKKAYLTAAPAALNKEDFYIVDVSNPELDDLPIYGNPINTGKGLVAVQVSSKYAFVASLDPTAQLYVINIQDPDAPFVINSATRDVTSDAEGSSIFYFDKKLYLGLSKSVAGPEFRIFNMADPENPTEIASYEINSRVNAIRVKNGIAYLAVPDDPATMAISEQLKILDVSEADSGIVNLISAFGPNPSTMSGQGLYLSKDGEELMVGMQGANPGEFPEFYWLDVSTPSSPDITDSLVVGGSVRAIAMRENLAFLWTNVHNRGFQVWDIEDLDEEYGSLNTEENATGGFDCEGDYLYTGQEGNKALQIIGPT